MLNKCANPACPNSAFRYLHEGKLFVKESRKADRLEYYWLCDQCCRKVTIKVDAGGSAVAVLKPCA